ncbi:hypothetical protein [Roseibium marinum]|uniref:Uncharacterized protein n=1 Tax=Roseibium marinum TaxID=281252 RepID=A0A2S3UR76_9HYPH|nr:hypothetical protein [Roseibium marinum]POF30073.1 hypothetical protein CLV41_10799 [Roseibium marinum]
MSIQHAMLAAGVFLLGAANALAGSDLPKVGDTYIISRDEYHGFRGSHRIYNRMAEGLVEVEYCGRPYWVRFATVAWTQIEVERENAVRVEFNQGKGWRPICAHPERQVTLLDLGVQEDPRIVVQNDGVPVHRVSRFSAIRNSFKTAVDTAARSYHGAQINK